MAILIGRHQEGISLNPLEFILNDDGTAMEFKSPKHATQFLRGMDCDLDDINGSIVFFDTETEEII